jgi:hypothetical protein
MYTLFFKELPLDPPVEKMVLNRNCPSCMESMEWRSIYSEFYCLQCEENYSKRELDYLDYEVGYGY